MRQRQLIPLGYVRVLSVG